LFIKERRNAGKAFSKNRSIEASKNIDDDDDDDDNEEEKDKEEMDITDESISSVRERRFRSFASIEYNGEIYMVIDVLFGSSQFKNNLI
jgi:hypothetical protein